MEKEVYLAHTVLKAGNPRPVRSISAASGERRESRQVRPEVKESQESDFRFFFPFLTCAGATWNPLKLLQYFPRVCTQRPNHSSLGASF